MTERRLPPALEVFAVTNGVRLLTERQVLDWFYGPSCPNAALHENGWKCNWSGHSTPGLVERVEERLYEDGAQDWQDALRAELGEEP